MIVWGNICAIKWSVQQILTCFSNPFFKNIFAFVEVMYDSSRLHRGIGLHGVWYYSSLYITNVTRNA
jgi:hypothetical protein